ncbi:cytochrome c oxidase assembly protein [Plantactinospora sp. KBS50]|uniref:cytochrome c oxidase assembly protein n=1 Tax=Plantactinospora sp. KBS50 TaxID=2024580 RepID=UPI000BAAA0F6|nr:cytochrome c oxidase assembly protein [Plantactinospora sp. KBS50]ASW55178.1 cytochrome-c oxidase [Plantactinospora sp. KBS50]
MSTTGATAPAERTRPGVPARARPRWWLPAVIGAAAVAVLFLALTFGHGLTGSIPGLPEPGRLTSVGLPVVRLALDVLATAAVGLSVTAAFLLPGDGPSVSARGYLLLRRVAPVALGWALAAVALLVLTLSDLLGQPVDQIRPGMVASFAVSVSQGQSLAWQAGLALVLAALSRSGVSRNRAAATAVLALITVLPPAFTGHAAGAGNHQVAVTSLALHVASAALWVGGLAGLLTLRRTDVLAGAAARYSRLALVCFGCVAVSGIANAWVRLGTWGELWGSRYGVLVFGKLAALVLLGTLGAMHRARTLPALRAGRPGAFRRLAGGELVTFGATFGLAVALSRSPTPVPTNPVDPDPITSLIGFPMPAAPSAANLLGNVLPDMFFLTATVFAVGAYLIGVLRLHRAGVAWPVARTACWLAGWALLAAVTDLGFARYAYVLFSAHMAQHMVLSMAVPILLVNGAPVTLALRALRRPDDPEVRGPRDWLLAVIHSRVLRLLTHPLVALGIYTASLYGLYFSDLLGTLMRYHLGHLGMLLHFVVSGYLLFWVLVGVDPGRRRLAAPLLVIIHFAAMSFHAFFGIVLMQSNALIAPEWYTPLHPPWAASPLADQHLGAAIAWSFGEIPAAIVMLVLVRQWIRSDEREQARLDRAADRAAATGEEDELARYNAFLAAAAAADRESRSAGR